MLKKVKCFVMLKSTRLASFVLLMMAIIIPIVYGICVEFLEELSSIIDFFLDYGVYVLIGVILLCLYFTIFYVFRYGKKDIVSAYLEEQATQHIDLLMTNERYARLRQISPEVLTNNNIRTFLIRVIQNPDVVAASNDLNGGVKTWLKVYDDFVEITGCDGVVSV